MKIPARQAFGMVLFSALMLAMLFLDEPRRGFGQWGVAAMTIFMGLSFILGALHLLSSSYWVYGIEIKDDGFIFHGHLRRTRVIRYSSIYRIVVSSYVNGSGESSSTIRIKSIDGNAWLAQDILYGTDILYHLKKLADFDHIAWSRSYAPEDSWLWSVIPKKTVVLDLRTG